MKCIDLRVLPAVAGVCVLAFAGSAGADDLADRAMYGFNRDTGEMYRYHFDDAHGESFGILRDESGRALVGIDAAVFGYAFSRIYAFWYDGESAEARLVYVDPDTGATQVNPYVLDGGPITGATAVKSDREGQGTIFAVQSMEGYLGVFDDEINPNTGGDMEFTLELVAAVDDYGDTITRWDLMDWAKDGVRQPFSDLPQFGGVGWVEAKRMTIRPKGSARLEAFDYLEEAHIEVTTSSDGSIFDLRAMGEPMLVYAWNTAERGAATGDWYVKIEAAPAEGVVYTGPSRLITVDHLEGTVTPIAELSRMYDALATLDGEVFYASSGGVIYEINASDPDNVTEKRIAATDASSILGLDFAGESLMGFDTQTDYLHRLDVVSDSEITTGPAINVSMSQCGSIVFSPDPFSHAMHD